MARRTGPGRDPERHGRNSALDGVRALAVTAVFLFHAGVSRAPGGMFGVDAFEHDQTCGRFQCGQAATRVMRARLQGQVVACAQQDVDPYGRAVAVCTAGGEDLGRVMVRAGLAVAYRHFSLRYLPDETWAQAHRQGAWAYGFDSPQYWRRTHVRK